MIDKIKEKADKMRAMSDEELVAYVENRVQKARSEGFNQGKSLKQRDIDNLIRNVVNIRGHIIGLVDDINTLTARLNER